MSQICITNIISAASACQTITKQVVSCTTSSAFVLWQDLISSHLKGTRRLIRLNIFDVSRPPDIMQESFIPKPGVSFNVLLCSVSWIRESAEERLVACRETHLNPPVTENKKHVVLQADVSFEREEAQKNNGSVNWRGEKRLRSAGEKNSPVSQTESSNSHSHVQYLRHTDFYWRASIICRVSDISRFIICRSKVV